MARVLDIAPAQVCVYYEGDARFEYHHRILLQRYGPGRWVALTPDRDLTTHDLNEETHYILDRGEVFPDFMDGNCYAFDPLTVEPACEFRAEGKAAGYAVRGD